MDIKEGCCGFRTIDGERTNKKREQRELYCKHENRLTESYVTAVGNLLVLVVTRTKSKRGQSYVFQKKKKRKDTRVGC